MPHRLILGVAITLSMFFVALVLAFAWSAGVHDATLTASVSGATPLTEQVATAPSGIDSFEKRCARCHSSDDVTAWTSKQSGNRCEALYGFLQEHRKAPESENRTIALLFAPGCSAASRNSQ